jgi:hypothetical protein
MKYEFLMLLATICMNDYDKVECHTRYINCIETKMEDAILRKQSPLSEHDRITECMMGIGLEKK